MKTKEIFNQIVKEIAVFLKENGFKKKHHTFYKKEEKEFIINFQLSKYNDRAHTDFFINYGLHDHAIFTCEINNTWDCLVERRVISIKQEKDDKISLDSDENIPELILKIKESFQCQIFSFYDDHKTTDEILEYLISHTGLARYQQVFPYLFKTNQLDKVDRFTKNIVSLIGYDQRTEKILGKISEMGQTYGHKLQFKNEQFIK